MQCLYFSVWTLLCINFVSAGISFGRKKSSKYIEDYTLPTPESWAYFDHRPINPSLINDKKSVQIPDPPQNDGLLKRLKSTMIHYGSDEDEPAAPPVPSLINDKKSTQIPDPPQNRGLIERLKSTMIHYGSDEDEPAAPPVDQSSFRRETAPASNQETHLKTDRKWINQGSSEETSNPKKSNQNWPLGVSSEVNPRANPAPPTTYKKMPSLINDKKSTQIPDPPQNRGLIEKLKSTMIHYGSDEDEPADPPKDQISFRRETAPASNQETYLKPSLINDKKSTQIPDPPQNKGLIERLKSEMIHYGSDEDKPADPPKKKTSKKVSFQEVEEIKPTADIPKSDPLQRRRPGLIMVDPIEAYDNNNKIKFNDIGKPEPEALQT